MDGTTSGYFWNDTVAEGENYYTAKHDLFFFHLECDRLIDEARRREEFQILTSWGVLKTEDIVHKLDAVVSLSVFPRPKSGLKMSTDAEDTGLRAVLRQNPLLLASS
jgi:hypothetical protein